MKKIWLNKLPFASDFPILTVDDAPESDQVGGGSADDSIGELDHSDDDSEPLGEEGRKALTRERQARKERERELSQLREQLKAVAEINPDLYKQTLARAEELKRTLEEKERETTEATRRIREKADSEVRAARQAADAAERARIDLLTKTAGQQIFRLNKGLDEVDEVLGQTSFDGWWRLHGSQHLRWDNKLNNVVVVDKDGDPITEDGKPVDPVKWLDEVADKSPMVAQYFKSKSGEGSGGLQGARNVRTVTSRSKEDLAKLSPDRLLEEHYGNK
jgi:hypothetical protein